jgi:hypothetical protein
MTKFTLADQTEINARYDIGERFFEDMLALSIHDCMVTDLSALSDFSGCGLPTDLKTDSMSLDQYYAAWRTWVIGKIRTEYGITIENTNIMLVELFGLIRAKRELH